MDRPPIARRTQRSTRIVSTSAKRITAITAGILVVATGAFFLLGNRKSLSNIPGLAALAPDPKCPLTGLDPATENLVERPAVAIKVENNPVAYPLSGLQEAEIVYEEQVEGGQTRFMALFHCGDTAQAGPIRSSRVVDAAIMTPMTRILAAAGGNAAVRASLEGAGIVLIDESDAGDAMTRIPRTGISTEHTLYGDSAALRRLGRKSWSEPPPDDMFTFGELEGTSKRARSIDLTFGQTEIRYEWDGDAWLRFDRGSPLVMDDGEQITVENVVIEEHTINLSQSIGDVTGAMSTEIADVTGSGRAFLFRDGRVIPGRWTRETEEGAVEFTTKDGDAMVLAPGNTWIELLPNQKGEVKGTFSFAK